MAIIVVGGSSKDIGKTALVCSVISALRDFGWTAVKITGHDYGHKLSVSRAESQSADTIVREDTNAGQGTDTARYLAAGARRALLVTRRGAKVPIDDIRVATKKDRNIIFESNRIIDAVQADLCLALVGGGSSEMKPSFVRLLKKADALVTFERSPIDSTNLPADMPRFNLQSLDHLSTEMVTWLRSRLKPAPKQNSISR